MGTRGAGLKVLVVDDYPDAAQALGLLLEASSHRVRLATDPAAAEGVAVAFAPDVVTLEVRLRSADGWALARRLVAQLGARPAVMAVTGYAGAGTEERCRAAGIDRVLVKGDDPRALVAAIRAAGVRPIVRNPTDN